MALVPENRPTWQTRGDLQPANTLQPQTGIWYDAAGNPQIAYLPAYRNAAGQPVAAPGASSATSFLAVTPSDTVPLRSGVQALYFATAQTTLSIKGVGDTVAVAMGAQAAGSTLRGQFGFVMATGTSPGTGIVSLV